MQVYPVKLMFTNTQFGSFSTLRRPSTLRKQRPGIYIQQGIGVALERLNGCIHCILGTSSSTSLRNSRLSSVSESESEWRSESIIVQNPLSVIVEEKDVEWNKLSVIGESDYEESEFGADDMQSENVIKVNFAALDHDIN